MYALSKKCQWISFFTKLPGTPMPIGKISANSPAVNFKKYITSELNIVESSFIEN